MATDTKQIRKFFDSAQTLLGTSKTMQEIYLAATAGHAKEKAITYINDKGKIVSYKYKKYRTYCFEAASRLSQKLGELPKNTVVALKLKNCPDWPILFWALQFRKSAEMICYLLLLSFAQHPILSALRYIINH